MERIDKPGKTTFWSFKDSTGKTHSVWDEALADQIKIGSEMELQIKTSPDGKFSNIRGIGPDEDRSTDGGQTETPAKSQVNARPDEREKSIVAQCLTKVWGDVAKILSVETQEEADELRNRVLENYKWFKANL